MTKSLRLEDVDYASTDLLFFVTIRAHPRRKPFTAPPVAQAVIASTDWLRKNRGVSIYAFCLMPDHLHILMRLGENSQPQPSISVGIEPYPYPRATPLCRAACTLRCRATGRRPWRAWDTGGGAASGSNGRSLVRGSEGEGGDAGEQALRLLGLVL